MILHNKLKGKDVTSFWYWVYTHEQRYLLSSESLYHSLNSNVTILTPKGDGIRKWDFWLDKVAIQLLSRVQLFAIHGLQHTRLPCPSPSLRVCSNSCPLSRWWHPTTPSSVFPFSSCLQSFPASGSFPMSQLFTSDGQSIEALASVLQYSGLIFFKTDWLYLLAVQGTLKSLLQHHSSKASILQHSAFMIQLSHPYMTTGKTMF